jgi:cation diffusion facilitator family transporter
VNDNCTVCEKGEAAGPGKAEGASIVVSIITLLTMAAEIFYGILSGSLALLSDGIHMGTHAFALFITALSYFLARKHRRNPAFSFGTGKIGVLGGFTNALLLGFVALFMVYESVKRFIHPESIAFDQAILVAVIGLAVNLVCAFILNASGKGEAAHGHAHEHGNGHEHGHERHDSNLKAALLHVATDAFTSVLAIAALVCGKFFSLPWLDSAAGLLGAAMILKWAASLLKSTAFILLDFGDYREEIERIRKRIGECGASVCDIHVWRYSENERSLIMSLDDPRGRSSAQMRKDLGDIGKFHHVTIEVCGR